MFFKSVSAGAVRFITSTLIAYISIGILARELNTFEFGVIILATNLNHYYGLIVMLFTSTTARYASLSYYSKNYTLTSQQVSSAFYSVILIGFLIIFGIFIYFKVAADSLDYKLLDMRLVFLYSFGAMLLMSLVAILNAGFFITSKFYISDYCEIVGKVLSFAAILLIAIKSNLTPTQYTGFIFLGAAVTFILSLYKFTKLGLDIRLRITNFRVEPIVDMFNSGKYVLVNSTGVMLYTATDLLLVHYYFGSATLSIYGPAVQYATILPLVAVILSKMIEPNIAKLISQDAKKETSQFLESAVHALTSVNLTIGILLILIASKVFSIWLPDIEFFDKWLVCLLIANSFLHLSTAPIFSYLLITKNLRKPAAITLVIGLLNLIFSILLIKYTSLGLYAPAVASLISITAKTVFYNVHYTSGLIYLARKQLWMKISLKLTFAVSIVLGYYFLELQINNFLQQFAIYLFLILITVYFAVIMVPKHSHQQIKILIITYGQ